MRALDFRERAPLGATRDMYLDARGQLRGIGHGRSRVTFAADRIEFTDTGDWLARKPPAKP